MFGRDSCPTNILKNKQYLLIEFLVFQFLKQECTKLHPSPTTLVTVVMFHRKENYYFKNNPNVLFHVFTVIKIGLNLDLHLD